MHRRLEFSEGSSDKFWEVEVAGATVTTRWGRKGTAGQEKAKDYPDEAAALRDAEAQLQGKVKKGYAEVGGAPAPAGASAPAPKAAPAPPAPAPKATQKAAPAPPAPTPKATPAPPTPTPAPAPPAGPPVAAAEPRLHWTEAARGRLHPVRLPEAPARPPAPGKVAKLIAAAEQHRQGLGVTVPTLRARVRAALDLAGPVDEAILGALAEFGKLTASNAGLLLDRWQALGGLPLALEAALGSLAYAIREGTAHRWLVRTADLPLEFRPSRPGAFGELRRRVAAAPEAEYDAARAVAERLRETEGFPKRCLLDYLFPREAAWAEQDARDVPNHLTSTAWGWKVYPATTWGLLTCLQDPGLAETLLFDTLHMLDADLAFSLVDRLGVRAVPLLERWLGTKDAGAETRRTLAEALALVESDGLARVFARALDDRDLRSAASAWFAEHPATGLPALAAAAAGTGRGRDSARTVLAGLLRASDLAAAVAALPDRERRACEEVLEKSARQVPEASPDELPAVLARPPWLDRRAEAKPTVVDGLAPLEREEAVDWAGLTPPQPYYYDRPPLDGRRDADRRKDLEADLRKSEGTHLWAFDRFSDAGALAAWNELPAESWWLGYKSFLNLLARFGAAGMPGYLAMARRDLGRIMEVLERLDSPRVAPFVAEAYGRLQKWRGPARAWLLRHPETAAVGLVPDAVGRPGKPRTWAGDALRALAAEGHADTVRAVAARYGPEAARAVEETLAFDPLRLHPPKLPRMPAFWQPESLPRPLLRGRERALPLEAVQHLGAMLAFTTPDDPYVGLAHVREACDPASLDEFAWDLFSAWNLAGASAKDKWALYALALVGGDECARRLAPLIREWPGQGAQARAEMGLEVLARLGTDVALMHLHGMSQRLKYKALQAKARQRIAELAEARGLTAEELADRLVPDLDLEEDGSRVFDFGPRRFRVVFGPDLSPAVVAEDGKRLPDLPKPLSSDDAALAEEASKAWKAFKKDLKTLARDQVLRLELAMCSRRRWEAGAFRMFLVEHPLLGHLAQRLVWGVYGEGLQATFRVAEDRTLADVEDEVYTLPDGAFVGIVHPLDLAGDLGARWAALLADYRVDPPFLQLARPVHRVRPDEEGSTDLVRYRGREVTTGRVVALENRGWRKGSAWDSGVALTVDKALPGGLTVTLELDPGIYLGGLGVNPRQTLGKLQVHGSDERPVALGTLDPLAFSEIVADLEAL